VHVNTIKVQRLILDVLKANDKNEHDAADIVCAECKSIIATLHAPAARSAGVRDKKVTKASEMAAQEIDRLIDPSAPDEERQLRKCRLDHGRHGKNLAADPHAPCRPPESLRCPHCRGDGGRIVKLERGLFCDADR
jgi:hypothetical protein